MERTFQSRRYLITIQDIINFIDKGEKFNSMLEVEDDISFLGAIILNPVYQRNYRSSVKEESSIIESLLCDIPIPEIFLVANRGSSSQIRNVMDGKHRLNAIYRFFRGKYKLTSLSLLEGENGKFFNDLSHDNKIKFLTTPISVLEFFDLASKEQEVNLFTRYNERNKKLSKQELLSAALYSESLKYVNKYIEDNLTNGVLNKIYNVTPDRLLKQSVHQEILMILGILESGISYDADRSTAITERYMTAKSELFNKNEDEDIIELKSRLESFNEYIVKLGSVLSFPFSSEISDVKSSNYKFQVGIAILHATIYHYFDINTDDIDKTISEIKELFESSHIFQQDYKGSSSSTKYLKKYWLEKLLSDSDFFTRFETIKLKDTDTFFALLGKE